MLTINNYHLTILALILLSYALAVIVFPTVDYHGIMHNAMPVTAVFIIIYFCRMIHGLSLKSKILIFLGLVMEMFAGVWLYVIILLEGVVYQSDYNWTIKASHKVIFISDILTKNPHLFFICLAVCLQLVGIVMFAILFLRQPHYGPAKL